MPEVWHHARVAAIFKKGDVADCGNYRPISLLQIGYKLFASILLQRFKNGGAEQRIWHTQFGFCTGRGTLDAIFLARRLIEDAQAIKDRTLILLALDWAKAFDSIAPDRLVNALHRFGVPRKMVDTIRAIYTNRTFYVRDAGDDSPSHPQQYGISQGCPLSPFLFGIIMTILMTDAKAQLATSAQYQTPPTLVQELLYADDTLLVDVDSTCIQQYMKCVAEQGKVYGLVFNWGKLETLPLNCSCSIPTPEGGFVKQKERLVYLGSVLCADGSAASELNRRIGAARGEFDKLSRIWKHSCVLQGRKLEIFNACVISKLTYNLHSLWLNVAETRRLDAFHIQCLRKILHIPHSYYSRVSNSDVLQRASANSLSATLLERQLRYMGELACRPDTNVLKQSVFRIIPGSFEPKVPVGPRRRGRPKMLWSKGVFEHAVLAAGSRDLLKDLWRDDPAAKTAWKDAIHQYCHARH